MTQRVDAQRNRAKILAVAAEAFAAEGLSVPVQEIARRAGVSTGTVSRHFPTKDALFEAIVVQRGGALVDAAAGLDQMDPALAFRTFFERLVEEGIANRAIADALAGSGFDLASVGLHSANVLGALERLLEGAQRAGSVRGDIDLTDVKILIGACVTRDHAATDAAARTRMIQVATDGLAGAATAHPQ